MRIYLLYIFWVTPTALSHLIDVLSRPLMVGISHLTHNPTNGKLSTMMTTIIRDADFEKIADSVKPDAKRRVVLQKVQTQEGVSYHIYRNSLGQILLDPQVTIPAAEAWLFNNPKALASVRRGLSDAAKGRVSKVDLKSL
jgi:hypothetical protein